MKIQKGQVWLVQPWEFTPHEGTATYEIVKNGRELVTVARRGNGGRGPRVTYPLLRRVLEGLLSRRGELTNP